MFWMGGRNAGCRRLVEGEEMTIDELNRLHILIKTHKVDVLFHCISKQKKFITGWAYDKRNPVTSMIVFLYGSNSEEVSLFDVFKNYKIVLHS